MTQTAESLAAEIKAFLKGDVSTDIKDLDAASRDYSIFKVEPEIVVFPKDAEDVERLVSFVSGKKRAGENISLTARSAGTDMTGGPLSQSIVLSFTKYVNKIGELKDGTISVEPGVYFRDLEKYLAAQGWMYPAYPASKDICALGGMVANNSGGEKTMTYGKTEKHLRELTVVLADGKARSVVPLSGAALQAKLIEPGFEGDIYRQLYALIEKNYDLIQRSRPDVTKNSAGYYLWNVWDKTTFDLNKLIVGSQGTLCMVTEATLAIMHPKKYSRMAVIFLRDLNTVSDLIIRVMKFKPESIESYDDKTLSIALKFWREIIASMKGSIIKLGWQFIPELLMVLRGGMPKMIVLVELTSDDEADLAKRLEALRVDVVDFEKTHSGVQVRVLRDAAEAEKYWTIRRQSFALLHAHSANRDTAPFIDDVVVRPEHLPKFLPRLNAILEPYKADLTYTIAGHPGDGNFHIIPLMDLKDARVRALIPVISAKVYQLVHEFHGSITAEHNDGLVRTPYLSTMYAPEVLDLFAQVKRIFDPLDIFNPGKKVDGDLQYGLDHISSARP